MRSQPLAEFTQGRLDDRVAPFVASVVGYRTVGFPPDVHVGLPSPALTMIVSLGDPVHVSSPRPGGAPGRFTALAGGLHDAPELVRHDGNQFGIHLELTPAGSQARTWLALFERPAHPLGGVGMLTLIATGIWMLVVRWGAQAWIVTALVVVAVMMVASGVLARRALERLRVALGDAGTDAGDWSPLADDRSLLASVWSRPGCWSGSWA